jgi:probable HAF family extracellular repeat protein
MQTQLSASSGHKALSVWVCSFVLLATNDLVAQSYFPIYGGATYSSSNGGYYYDVGYGSYYHDQVDLRFRTDMDIGPVYTVNDAGVAVGMATFYDQNGTQATEPQSVRFSDNTAPVAMNNLNLDSANGAMPLAINNSGVAVGLAFSNGSSGLDARPVRWNAAGTVATELDHIGADSNGHTYAGAFGVNAAGTAVGFSAVYDSNHNTAGFVATRWNAGGTAATPLIGTSNNYYSAAYAINDSGTVVGFSESRGANGEYFGDRAFRWDNGSVTPTELLPLGASSTSQNFSYAWGVNSAGTAIGISGKFDVNLQYHGWRAVRWDANQINPTELGTIGPDAPGDTSAVNAAYAINTTGTTVGIATMHDSDGNSLGTRPVKWNAGGSTATQLGLLGTNAQGITAGKAEDVNDNGGAVGVLSSYVNGNVGQHKAVYWRPNGAVIDLNSLIDPSSGWDLQDAVAISNTGWVTGWGYFTPSGSFSYYNRQFLLQLPLLGDFNRDGHVDAADILPAMKALTDLAGYESQYGVSAANLPLIDDVNGDGSFNNADLQSLLTTLKSGGGSADPVPEPASIALLSFGALAIAFRRRAH